MKKIMLDNLDSDHIVHISLRSLNEKGRRLPIHSIHRWWSRRFSALYRGILSSYLLDVKEKDLFYQSFDNPALLRNRAHNKTFFEPFSGGGTGITEAFLFGYNVWGIDINPLATKIATVTLSLLQSSSFENNELEKIAIKTLDTSLTELKNFWVYDGQIISYAFITRTGDVPSWITVYRKNKKTHYVLRCPKCGHIFEINEVLKSAVCPICNYEFSVTYKPQFKIKTKNLPRASKKWKIWAIETRDPKRKWKKKILSPELDEKLYAWLNESSEKAEMHAKDIEEFLADTKIEFLLEGKRLKREGVDNLGELYTWKQLVSFRKFAELTKNLPLKSKLSLSIAVSESAKSSSVAAKWHSPIGEPVPAGAMKTYWIPQYTVETNPLAHVWGTLRPLSRNSVASAIRIQLKVLDSVSRSNEFRNTWNIDTGDSEHMPYPPKIDLAVVDPPYLDSVKSYASLALVHYGALGVFDHYSGIPHKNSQTTFELREIEKNEIPRNPQTYKEKLLKILSKIHQNMDKRNGRVVFLYNRKSIDDWIIVFDAIKNSGFYPKSIFWVLGESPGALARSKLKGIFTIILQPTKTKSVNILFDSVTFKFIEKSSINIDIHTEKTAYDSMVRSIKKVYPEITVILR